MSLIKKSVVPTDYEVIREDPSFRAKIVRLIAKALGKPNIILKRRRSVVPKYVWDVGPKLRRPEINYIALINLARLSWVLRKVFNAIIRECTRNWGHVEAKFRIKCNNCEETYQTIVDKCPSCGSKNLSLPDADQHKRALKLVSKPSPDRTFYEFIRATLFYLLATDDFYWSVVFKKINDKLLGNEVYVENPGFIFPIGDEYGRLGGYEYFCPICYIKPEYKNKDLVWDIRQESQEVQESKMFKCPICGELMVQTAYVQEIGGVVTARFGKNEIIHGSMSRLPPELFGNSKLITLIKIIQTLAAIDDYQLEMYTEGKIGGLLLFPGLDQERVGEILTDVKTEREALAKRDLLTGELEPKKRTALIFVGLEEGEKPVKIPFLEAAEAARTLDYYKMYINAIDQVYGLETTIQVSKRGAAREIRTKIQVKRETAQEYQRLIANAINNELFPLFGITDWVWQWEKLEAKDLLRDAEILHQTMAAAVTARNAGFNVKYEDGTLQIWGEATGEAEVRGRTGLPNIEPGVAPRRVSREFVRPYEISPITGEEIIAGTLPVHLAEYILDILNEARERSHEGKETLSEILRDARTKLFRVLSRANLRLDRKEALYASFDKLLENIINVKG